MRLIDADALCEYANNQIDKTVDANDIMRFPRVDAVPVVHGRWIKKEFLHCSECDMPTMYPWPYCQKCGAKMDGGVTDA